MNIFNIKERKIIVTGAAQGLSLGIVKGFLEAGAEVSIIDISPKTLDVAKDLSYQGYRCHGFIANIIDTEDRKGAFDDAIAKMGGLDVFVNGAGTQKRHKSEDFPMQDWNFVMDVNLNATFAMCQLAGRYFLKNNGGKIINISSMLAFFGGYTVPAYAASKGGVSQLTKALANEWASKNINVNAIAPGYMDTEMNVNLVNDESRNKEITARIPAGRWGTPEDMVGICIFLSSEASRYLNGAIIPVDGGYLSR